VEELSLRQGERLTLLKRRERIGKETKFLRVLYTCGEEGGEEKRRVGLGSIVVILPILTETATTSRDRALQE